MGACLHIAFSPRSPLMGRRESATRSQWRTESGRLATAAAAPHGLHPLSRLWPSNSLPARRAHSNALAAPADCQCYPGRRASEPGRTSAVRTRQRNRHRHLLQQLQQHKVAGRRPPAELPSHPAPPRHPAAGTQCRVRQPYRSLYGSRAAREPRRSLQRLPQQRAHAHAT